MKKFYIDLNKFPYVRIHKDRSVLDGCIGKLIDCTFCEIDDTLITIELLDGTIVENITADFIDFLSEGDVMNMKKEKLTGYKNVAVIRTDGGINDYHFAIYDDGVDYHPGDKVIVTGNNKIQEISEIITPEEAKDRFDKDIIAEVIGRIDTTAYDKRVEKRKEAKRIKEEMDKKVKEMDELLKYEMYAKQSPEFLALLDKYKELVK